MRGRVASRGPALGSGARRSRRGSPATGLTERSISGESRYWASIEFHKDPCARRQSGGIGLRQLSHALAPHVLAEFRSRCVYGPIFGLLNIFTYRRVSKRVSTRTLNYAMKRALN